MCFRKSWLMIGALLAFSASAADIYKWKDADGVVHYSDQPHEGATKITTTSSISTYSGNEAVPRSKGPAAPGKGPAAAVGPMSVTITSPGPNQTFFGDNAVSASLSVSPALKPSQLITWKLNGAPLDNQPTTATQVTLPILSRGTYSLSATVADQDSGEMADSNTVTFFVQQPSTLSPQHKH
jgi:hypothetical protein